MEQQLQQQPQYTIMIEGKTHLRSKNASIALKRSIRSFIKTTPPTQNVLQSHQPFQDFAKHNYQLDFFLQPIVVTDEASTNGTNGTTGITATNATITIKATQTRASIEKDKLKDKLNTLKQQRTQSMCASTASRTNQAYKKLITTLNQQPNGAMLSKLIPDPKKLSESSPQELQMQTSLFGALPMNNQLKKLIMNYFNSI